MHIVPLREGGWGAHLHVPVRPIGRPAILTGGALHTGGALLTGAALLAGAVFIAIGVALLMIGDGR